MRGDCARNCPRTGRQPDPGTSLLFKPEGHENGSAGGCHRVVDTNPDCGSSIEVCSDNPAIYTWYDSSAGSPGAALTCGTKSRIDSQHAYRSGSPTRSCKR